MKKQNIDVAPLDAQIGGDDDIGGIAQTITSDDIQSTLHSPKPVNERIEELRKMEKNLQNRQNADRGYEFETLIHEVRFAQDTLKKRNS